jgi:hypothetical protein
MQQSIIVPIERSNVASLEEAIARLIKRLTATINRRPTLLNNGGSLTALTQSGFTYLDCSTGEQSHLLDFEQRPFPLDSSIRAQPITLNCYRSIFNCIPCNAIVSFYNAIAT